VASRFHLLGFRALDFGTPPDWHSDPTRQRRASRSHWSRVPYLDESLVGDHKIIWELNRHQWLVTLAQAWQLTGDPKYPETIARTLDHWLANNPPRQGINWASSLELAFRAIAWTWSLHLAGTALPGKELLLPRVAASLELHGLQIERFLSTWFSPNTHLTGEALGLLYLGTAWPAWPRSARWRETGWRILLDQLPVHVRTDGTYFEQTTWYQAYTADFYLHALSLARASRLEIPPAAEERIARAAEVVRELRRPDGSLPLIGDDDGGRLLPLDPVRTCFNDTSALAASLLPRPETCFAGPIPAGLIWLTGEAGWSDQEREQSAGEPVRGRAFLEGGWHLLRGPEGCLVVDAGPHGALSAGHSHADALSVDLTVRGKPVVVDPGTGSYVGSWRDRFRSTTSHSTLCLAGGIDSASPSGPFRWEQWPATILRHWSVGPEWTAFEAEHDGFTRLAPDLTHRRTILFRDGWGWLLLDRLGGKGAAAEVRFQLDAGLAVQPEVDRVVVEGVNGGALLWICTDGAGTTSLGTGLVSRCYGEASAGPVVIRTIDAEASRLGVVTLLASSEAATIIRDPAPGNPSWLWRSPSGAARIRVGPGGVTSVEADGLTLTLN
jgi:hypothetical protein